MSSHTRAALPKAFASRTAISREIPATVAEITKAEKKNNDFLNSR